MKKYYIYLKTGTKPKTKEPEVFRMYFTSKVKEKDMSDNMEYVGCAELSEDYFIIGSETQYTSVVDLNQVELCYTANTKNGRISEFSHTFQEMLERAKEGILPYISFSGHKVNRLPILKINGKKHSVKNKLELEIE